MNYSLPNCHPPLSYSQLNCHPLLKITQNLSRTLNTRNPLCRRPPPNRLQPSSTHDPPPADPLLVLKNKERQIRKPSPCSLRHCVTLCLTISARQTDSWCSS